MSNFLKQASARWSATSPVFFKKIKTFGAGLAATGTSLAAGGGALPPTVHFPPMLITIGGYMIVAGLVSAAVAKLTCDDPPSPKQ